MICNDGYTIERYIHGWKDSYNDIQTWDFGALLPTFGAKRDQFKVFKVKTKQELADLFSNKEFAAAKYIQVGCHPSIETRACFSDFSLARGTLHAPGGRARSAEADSRSLGEKNLRSKR